MPNGNSRKCPHADLAHVRPFVAYAKATLNSAWYYPPRIQHKYTVALALYSKCITVAEATIALLDAGFPDEAFGMTRTMTDIAFTLRYISNKDTDKRAKLYYEFFTKDTEQWLDVIKTYWPQQVQPLDARTTRLAKNYAHPHRWAGAGVTARTMAYEPDTLEVDPATGKPSDLSVAYRIVYRWTSHYVHPSVVALHHHIVEAGHDPFKVRSGRGMFMGDTAAFNITNYLSLVMIYFYRCWGDPQPPRLSTWAYALLKHLARRHNKTQ